MSGNTDDRMQPVSDKGAAAGGDAEIEHPHVS